MVKLNKKSVLVAAFLVVVLTTSAFLAVANKPSYTLEEYMARASSAALLLPDQKILSQVYAEMKKLPSQERRALRSFSSEEILAVAKGTDEGHAIVEALTPSQREAAEDLMEAVVSSEGVRMSTPLLWGGKKNPCTNTAVSPGGGGCVPGQSKCKEGGGIACQFTCGSGGTWDPMSGEKCDTAMCYGTQCHSSNAA